MEPTLGTSPVPHGQEDIPPAVWALFTGPIPKRGSTKKFTDSDWPRYRVLSEDDARSVLQKYNRGRAGPGQLKEEFIQFYVRNFDSRGYLVDSSLTASRGRHELPLAAEVAQRLMEEKNAKDSDKSSGNKGQSAVVMGIPDTATNTNLNTNSNGSTCTLLETTTTYHKETNTETVKIANFSTAGKGHRLDGGSLPKTPTKNKEPTSVLKRLAESPELRETNKRLKRENDKRATELQLSKSKLHRVEAELSIQRLQVAGLNDSIRSLETQNQQLEGERSNLDSELKETSGKAKALIRALDMSKEDKNKTTSQLNERSAKCNELENVVQGKTDQCNQLQAEIAAAKKEKDTAQGELQEKDEECEKLRRQVEHEGLYANVTRSVAARLLFAVDQMYDQIDSTEQDDFLEGIKSELGDGRYNSMLEWGKRMTQQEYS